MTEFAIAQPQAPAVPVRGGGSFPVRRIYCVGRNYPDHAREMGVDPDREPPLFFTKPADAVLTGGAEMPYPPSTGNLHYEMELVVALGAGGANVAAADAPALVWGYAAGLDMTRRDLQSAAKKSGHPWDMAKGFDFSAPIGEIAPAARIGHPQSGRIELKVNGATRQRSNLERMIWPVAEIIAHLSTLVRLAPGDLIFTGTPEGVGAVEVGDLLQGEVEGVGAVATRIARRGERSEAPAPTR